jgi:hypothetical protein
LVSFANGEFHKIAIFGPPAEIRSFVFGGAPTWPQLHSFHVNERETYVRFFPPSFLFKISPLPAGGSGPTNWNKFWRRRWVGRASWLLGSSYANTFNMTASAASILNKKATSRARAIPCDR